MSVKCPSCGSEIVNSGRGRRRTYCQACTPPQSGGAEWRKAWYAANAERLEAERRERHAEWIASYKASLRQHKATLARNRRALKRKRRMPQS
jgi:hypothetical protein